MELIKKNILVEIGLAIILCFNLACSVDAQEASFYVLPSKGSYKVGETFSVNVLISTEGSSINATEATIHFSPEILNVQEISKQNSILSLWTQEPVFSNSKGTIIFGGGLPNPGFAGKSGKIITILFKAKSLGAAQVSFGQEKILANDAWGTDIFSGSTGGTYFIDVPETEVPEIPKEPEPEPGEEGRVPTAPKVSSSTHPFSDKWYSNNAPEFEWKNPQGIIGVSTLFDQKPVSDPGNISEGAFGSKTFENVEDGIWYFHVKLQNNIGWSKISHFKIQIDTSPPEPFEIIIDNEGDPTNPHPILYFKAKDQFSGVSHYEIKIGQGDFFSLVEVQTNPYQLPYQNPGKYALEIKAVDMAGNKTPATSEVKVESIPVPEFTFCPETFNSGGEALYIEGTSLPNVKVLIFFKKDEKLVKQWEAQADEKGNWFLKQEGLFKSGLYRISVRAKDSKGAISDPSKECVFRVALEGISIGSWIISYASLSWLFLLLFIIGLILLLYLIWKVKKTKETRERETKDLKNKFYKEYNELKTDIERQIEMFNKAKGKRPLTVLEKQREKELLQDLSDVERVFREELKDIEDIK